MTEIAERSEIEIIAEQQQVIQKLQRKIWRLEKRLQEKIKYEYGLLQGVGIDPNLLAKIQAKDQKVLNS